MSSTASQYAVRRVPTALALQLISQKMHSHLVCERRYGPFFKSLQQINNVQGRIGVIFGLSLYDQPHQVWSEANRSQRKASGD